MPSTYIWYGHATCAFVINGLNVVVDPFFRENAQASIAMDDVPADYILVSHGHWDHSGDVEPIAQRTGATIIANDEIARYYAAKGYKTHGQHIGGGYTHPFGYLKLTHAAHGSGFPDGFPGGTASGFLLTTPEGKKVYLGCDTGLFGDMALIGDEGVEFAALPIGDNFTMGPDDALKAVKLLRPKRVQPYHYSTWDVIKQDEHAWVKRVNAETEAEAFVMQPGDTLDI